MAFNNYSDLQSSIANWLHRSDLTTLIPDFIKLAEVRMNRTLDAVKMEKDVTLNMTVGSRYVLLPTDMQSPIALWLETYKPRRELLMKLPSTMPVIGNVNMVPNYYCIDGLNLAFDCKADQAHELTFRYLQELNLQAQITNSVLQDYPDLYLYASLLEASPYVRDMNMIGFFQSKYDTVLKEISRDQNKNRNKVSLITEIPVNSQYNIYRG